MKYYTKSHEWISLTDAEGTVGVTVHAQAELGDIVYVELPEVGSSVKAGEQAVVLESTKAAADVYSPMSGTITAVNEALENAPELVNTGAEEDGWLFRMTVSHLPEAEDLLTKETYNTTVASS